ncbi:MAG: GEVED domain-containing protein, partial [Flavobacteriales bacterium]
MQLVKPHRTLFFLLLLFPLLVYGGGNDGYTYSSMSVTHPTSETSTGATDVKILKIAVSGTKEGGDGGDTWGMDSLTVTMLNDADSDVDTIELWYSGTTSTLDVNTDEQLGSQTNPTGSVNFDFTDKTGLQNSTYYLWVLYDIDGSASTCNSLDAKIGANDLQLVTSEPNCDSKSGGDCTQPSSEKSPSGDVLITGSGCHNYCSSSGNTTYTYLKRFRLEDLDHTWDAGEEYSNYVDSSGITKPILGANVTYEIGITKSSTSGDYDSEAEVYVDWNDDGDWQDANESATTLLDVTNNGTEYTTNMTVPSGTSPGDKALRVVLQEDASGDTDSCGSYSYGETEDHLINVTSDTMVYDSSKGMHSNTSDVNKGDTEQEVLGVKIYMSSDAAAPEDVTKFIFNTSGTSDPANDISNAK